MNRKEVIDWLLEGDVSIQYQTHKDVLGVNQLDLQKRISTEGWGAEFLSKRNNKGHWGQDYYQPKWISTHYTLLDLRNLCLHPKNKFAQESINMVLNTLKADDGGIKLGPSTSLHSDVCVNAMCLNFASYFNSPQDLLTSIVDSILNEKMPDGGFNCRTTRSGAVHSSMHTTISVMEGLAEFKKAGYKYRIHEIEEALASSLEFLLQHELFKSDKTGEIIHPDFLKFPYPSRWKYNVLRALDCFQYADIPWDDRMKPAIDFLMKKRRPDGKWDVQAAHPGKVHFVMEKAGKESRWNTLRVMRVLKHFNLLNM